MIVFDLSCECGCQFEGWFQDTADFHSQKATGLLSCPACGGGEVKKILSPVAGKKATVGKGIRLIAGDASPEQLAADLLKSIQNHVVNNYEDVGARLAEESLEIHYGLEKPRNIRGVSTAEEEKILEKEGIEILKIPLPVKDSKN